MSRFPRLRRRPDHWSSPHERARTRAAERLDGPLGLVEASWLEEHLAACPDCATIAAAYEADRAALRSLRDEAPVPPRDLWARTAAAIEIDRPAGGQPDPSVPPRRRIVPVGVLSGVAVIAVVVGVSAVSSGLLGGSAGIAVVTAPSIGSPSGSAPTPLGTPQVAVAAPTPIVVGAGAVRWFDQDADGSLAFVAAHVDSVCPVDAPADCAPLDGTPERPVAIAAEPKSIVGSPTEDQAVVVSDTGDGRQMVTVVALPTPQPTATIGSTATPLVSATPRPSSGPVATESPAPTQPRASDPAPTGTPGPTGVVSPEPTATAVTPSAEPTSSAAIPTDGPDPSLSPVPTVAAGLAILSDVTLVGEAADYSPDGSWFAFSARPADGSAGPDVYVWHVGDEQAQRLTEDGQSYFGSWSGGEVLVSRPGQAADDGAIRPVTVAIDPTTQIERSMGDLWRPVVDPTGRRVVAWSGTLVPGPDGKTMIPGTGHLELRPWSSADGATSSDPVAAQSVSAGSMPDFDIHWDETGDWFATWIADPAGSGVGRLSLHRLDPGTGLMDHPEGSPTDIQALPGFSLGRGRLAWATPPGQGGEGSRVQVVAWTGNDVGRVETTPGDDLIVVR